MQVIPQRMQMHNRSISLPRNQCRINPSCITKTQKHACTSLLKPKVEVRGLPSKQTQTIREPPQLRKGRIRGDSRELFQSVIPSALDQLIWKFLKGILKFRWPKERKSSAALLQIKRGGTVWTLKNEKRKQAKLRKHVCNH